VLLDLYLLSVNLVAGQEENDLPGLWVTTPQQRGAGFPRRVERVRTGDTLMILLSFPDSTPLPPNQLEETLQRLVKRYFTTRGSVTSGLRAAAEELNNDLLTRNLRDREGKQSVAVLQMAVFHNEILYLAHCGLTHTYLLQSQGTTHFSDDSGIRGMGVSRNLSLRMFQNSVHSGDLLVLCPVQPNTWNEETFSAGAGSIEALRRSLLSQAGVDLETALIQLQDGNGQIHRLRPRQSGMDVPARPARASQPAARPSAPVTPDDGQPASSDSVLAPEVSAPSEGASEQDGIYISGKRLRSNSPSVSPAPVQVSAASTASGTASAAGTATAPAKAVQKSDRPQEKKSILANLFQKKPQAAPRSGGQASSAATEAIPAANSQTAAPVRAGGDQRPGPTKSESPARTPQSSPTQGTSVQKLLSMIETQDEKTGTAKSASTPAPSQPVSNHAPAQRPDNIELRRKLLKIWRSGRTASEKIDQGGKTFFSRVLPSNPDQSSLLSPASMLFLAIAVPLMVVAIAVSMYLYAPGGRNQQYVEAMAQAQALATQAAGQSDASLHRSTLVQSLDQVNEALRYGSGDDALKLRDDIQLQLDQIDGVQRLSLRPAVPGGFASNIKISRIAATSTEMYLLDQTQGRVLRANLQGTEYEVDSKFHCAPGASGSLTISRLIDVVIPSPNNQFNATAVALDTSGNIVYCMPEGYPQTQVLPVPETGWGDIRAFTLSEGILYVLDVTNNRIWYYVGNDLAFSEAPHLFFDNQVPTLTDVVDMQAYNEDLYLLHSDGKMTRCTLRGSSAGKTRCEDPLMYKDPNDASGRQNETIAEANFAQIHLVQPFEPSIYLLDTKNKSIYQFSMALNLHRQLRPSSNASYPLPVDKDLTAFTITSDLRVLLAYGNEVYTTFLPQ
jgi:hypothetical protein